MARISSALLVATAAMVGSASAFTAQRPIGAVSAHHASHVKQPVGALSPASPQTFGGRPTLTPLAMADSPDGSESNLPMLLDPGTKGGALFLSLVLFVVPIIVYQIGTNALGWDAVDAGRNIGVGFTALTTVLWVATYIFRVATKDMTYAKQLKDYENAVIAKRLEELDEDEIQALVEDIERDDF
uniref:Uncharacterized protein n=1 Tax=Minutocellus polymorphus TaxID=265543 RepID=A0A6U0JEK9_9STRA|mmetsp:Transcript_17108/g.28510  ORF Transcript_17108/g.28510 Transcript_17108/m.28510 type:complete len:185 (+) Transcript_17108:52-606(+)